MVDPGIGWLPLTNQFENAHVTPLVAGQTKEARRVLPGHIVAAIRPGHVVGIVPGDIPEDVHAGPLGTVTGDPGVDVLENVVADHPAVTVRLGLDRVIADEPERVISDLDVPPGAGRLRDDPDPVIGPLQRVARHQDIPGDVVGREQRAIQRAPQMVMADAPW